MTMTPHNPAFYRDLYHRTLTEDVAPFWLRYGLDRVHGGLCNVMTDAGDITSHDKYLWSQGRALWTFSALYHRIEPRPEWLDAARHCYAYLRRHGRDDAGCWLYRLDAGGRVLDGPISLYVDGFVMNGLGEYYRATGETEALSLALATYDNVRARLARPGSYGLAPFVVPPGLKTLGVAMIFSFFFYQLGKCARHADLCDAGVALARELLRDFYDPDRELLREFVTLDGQRVDSPEGRACVPGHVIESLWFCLALFEERGEPETIRHCCRLIRRHLELGWDEAYGGLRLSFDVEGREPAYGKCPDAKPWWVQVEALVATAYAFWHTREPAFLEWHERIRAYAYAHYPVPTGEWTQWLDREGRPMASAALPVKDPFHLPRALIALMRLFERLANAAPPTA